MKLVKYKIQDLKSAEYNPRKISDKQLTDLKKSITKFGIVDPIVINKNPERNNIVIGGHQRLRACLDLGIDEIDCVEVDLTLDKERELNVRLNKNGGEFDFHLLMLNFTKAEALEYGFDLKEIEKGLNKEKMGAQKEVNPERQEKKDKLLKKWGVSLGDLWALGSHRLYCGDSLDPKSYDKLLQGELCQMMFTDPPYGVSYKDTVEGGFDAIQNDDLTGEKLTEFLHKFIHASRDRILDNGSYYIWHASQNRREFERAIDNNNLRELTYIIWVKDNLSARYYYYRMQHEPCFFLAKNGQVPEYWGGAEDSAVWELYTPTQDPVKRVSLGNGIRLKHGRNEFAIVRNINKKLREVELKTGDQMVMINDGSSDVWYIKRDSTNTYFHPTQKPVELAEKAILNSSKAMDSVLDPFAGSGFTLLACERLQRKARCIELDPGYCAAILERYELATGIKGTKI